MFFWKSSEGGGAVISDPKNYIADFVGFKAVYFGKKKRNVISKKVGRGGSSERLMAGAAACSATLQLQLKCS